MKLKLKDPWSAITHGIALLLAAAGAAPLLLKAAHGENAPLHITALAIFILTMILLYTASTVYHSVDSTEKVNRRLRKMDHMMIFVMIAGLHSAKKNRKHRGRAAWPAAYLSAASLHFITEPAISSVHLYGVSQSSVFFSKDYGSHVPNGFLPYSILEWDGFVYLLSFLSFIPFREPDLDGFLPVVSSIRSVV